jgi:Cu-Zn family superoxide dismutase
MKFPIAIALLTLPLVVACETVDDGAGSSGTAGLEVRMSKVTESGVGEPIGLIVLSDTSAGLGVTVDLRGLPAGARGFHIHEKGDCSPAMRDGKPVAALAAGGHYDSAASGRHEGPHGQGHTGDLPALSVDERGEAKITVTAPRLTLKEVRGRSIMIHEGGDNYSDQPKPLGGGGARIACGVIPLEGQ